MLTAAKKVFFEVFTRNRKFIIPFFQRTYVWEMENWERFLTNMENLAENNEHLFMGSLVFKPYECELEDHKERFSVIDGQQRLTTLILFFRAMCALTDDVAIKNQCEGIMYLSTSSDEKDGVLEHNYNDIEIFEAIIKDELNDELRDKYSENNVLRCYDYFLKNKEIILKVSPNDITKYMYFISVELDKEEDEQHVFDIINTHGVSLTAAELLKNHLFSAKDKDFYESTWRASFESDEETREIWDYPVQYGNKFRSNMDFFLQAHLIKINDGKDSGADKLFSDYKNHIAKENLKSSEKKKKAFIKDLTDGAKIYREKINPYILENEEIKNDPLEVMNAIIFGLNITQVIPYILYITEQINKNKQITDKKDEMDKILKLLNSYLIRRLVCGLSPKAYLRIFTSFIKDDIDDFGKLKDKIYNFSDTKYDIFPNDGKFEECFLNSRLKHRHSKTILCIIEKALADRKKDMKRLYPVDSYNLEHVMPKDWEKNWKPAKSYSDEEKMKRKEAILSFGNLTILTPESNRSLGNSDWDTKRAKMKQYCSGVNIINDYLDYEKWDEDTIEERGYFLFSVAKKLWIH